MCVLICSDANMSSNELFTFDELPDEKQLEYQRLLDDFDFKGSSG